MRFLFEENQELAKLSENFRTRSLALIEGLSPAIDSALWPIGVDSSNLSIPQGLMVLKEGALSVSLNGRDLLFFEEGDMLPLEQLRNAGFLVRGEFAVIYNCYSFEQIEAQPKVIEQLITCLGLHQALMLQLVASLNKGESSAAPEIRPVKKGEVIASEGELSNLVYTLLEGHAEVISGDAIVGEVHPDELIGVIGALCGIPRIATVRATRDGLLMSLNKDEFVELLSLRPHMVVKLIADFARVISSSNQTVRSLAS